jgi:hypothetical protein
MSAPRLIFSETSPYFAKTTMRFKFNYIREILEKYLIKVEKFLGKRTGRSISREIGETLQKVLNAAVLTLEPQSTASAYNKIKAIEEVLVAFKAGRDKRTQEEADGLLSDYLQNPNSKTFAPLFAAVADIQVKKIDDAIAAHARAFHQPDEEASEQKLKARAALSEQVKNRILASHTSITTYFSLTNIKAILLDFMVSAIPNEPSDLDTIQIHLAQLKELNTQVEMQSIASEQKSAQEEVKSSFQKLRG